MPRISIAVCSKNAQTTSTVCNTPAPSSFTKQSAAGFPTANPVSRPINPNGRSAKPSQTSRHETPNILAARCTPCQGRKAEPAKFV